MTTAVMVGPDENLAAPLSAVWQELPGAGSLRVITHYPEPPEMIRILRATGARLLFLSAQDVTRLTTLVEALRQHGVNVPVVAFGEGEQAPLLRHFMRLGVRDLLLPPFTAQQIADVWRNVQAPLANADAVAQTDLLYTFLPAKPGVGTTTLALNAAVAIAEQHNTETLLIDGDLNSGLIRFLLKIGNPHSLLDATARAEELDENLWPQMVTSFDKLDVLHAGAIDPSRRVELPSLHQVLRFVRRHYGVICADLSGNLEKFSVDLMQESKRIFLVTTAELPALHLAAEKFKFLQRANLADRAALLLNRVHTREAITRAEVESLVGLPVYEQFPNDYQNIHRAVTNGQPVGPRTGFGQGCTALAGRLLEKETTSRKVVKRRFLEYLFSSPAALHNQEMQG